MTVLIDAGPRAGDSEGVGVMFEVLGSRKSDGRNCLQQQSFPEMTSIVFQSRNECVRERNLSLCWANDSDVYITWWTGSYISGSIHCSLHSQRHQKNQP